jgi:hypothetical protein
MRKSILARILEEEKLRKQAQEIEAPVDTAAADKMAEDIFNELFDQAIDEAGLNKLLD